MNQSYIFSFIPFPIWNVQYAIQNSKVQAETDKTQKKKKEKREREHIHIQFNIMNSRWNSTVIKLSYFLSDILIIAFSLNILTFPSNHKRWFSDIFIIEH